MSLIKVITSGSAYLDIDAYARPAPRAKLTADCPEQYFLSLRFSSLNAIRVANVQQSSFHHYIL
jgi:hypothetical protein